MQCPTYVDNFSMDASIYDSFMQGLNHKVPLLLGTNANETAMFGAMGNATETTVGEYQDMVKAIFTNEEDADKVLTDFPATTDEEAWLASVQVGTAQIFGGPDYILPSLLQTGANLSFSITSRKFQLVQMVVSLGPSMEASFHMYLTTRV